MLEQSENLNMRTIVQLFEDSVTRYSDHPFIWELRNEAWHAISYGETQAEVIRWAAGFLNLGLGRGAKIGLLAEGCRPWVVSELGLLYAGYTTVPLSVKLEEKELHYRLEHSETEAIIVSSKLLDRVRRIREGLVQLRAIIVLDGEIPLLPGELQAKDLLKAGDEALKRDPSLVNRAKAQVQAADLALISYTSGTTGPPKGVMLSHGNIVANTTQAHARFYLPEHFILLLNLPIDHSFPHVAGIFAFMQSGSSVAIVPPNLNPESLLAHMRSLRPHVMLSLPMITQRLRDAIVSQIRAKGIYSYGLLLRGLRVASAYYREGHNQGHGLSAILKPLVGLYDRMIFAKIREALGGRIECIIGGGAYLGMGLQRFFYSLGIPVLQGYGLTEASPIVSTNSPHQHKLGSSGKPVIPLEVRIIDANGAPQPPKVRGEITVRGANVMQGYWKDPAATRNALHDGWLKTGDLGYLDTDGFLHVLGRNNSQLIGMDGEKFCPEGIEGVLAEQSPFIDQILLTNNQTPYTAALIVPNRQALRDFLKSNHPDLSKTARTAKALDLIAHDINRYKFGGPAHGLFPDRWLPAAWAIVEKHFTERNGLMNCHLKILRTEVEKRYADRIAYLYTSEGKPVHSPANLSWMARVLE